jgi:hypothetical protein
MNTPTGGHRGHTPDDDRRSETPQRWLDVPPDVLWQFAVDLVTRSALRGVARASGLGVETVRKFILKMGEPNLSTRRRFAELFLQLHPEAVVEKDAETGRWTSRPRLITLLPEGRAEAREALAKLFALAGEHRRDLALRLDELHDWMDLQVCAEYNADEHFSAIARGERKHEPDSILARKPARSRKRRRADPDDSAGE